MNPNLASAKLSSPHHSATLPRSAPDNSQGSRVCSHDNIRNDSSGHGRENETGLRANPDKRVHERVERAEAVVRAESRESPPFTAASLEKLRVKLEPKVCESETTRSGKELGNRNIVSNPRSRKTSSLLSLPAPAFRSASSHQSNITGYDELDNMTPSDSLSRPTAYSAPAKGVGTVHVEEGHSAITRMSAHKYLQTCSSENSTITVSASPDQISYTEEKFHDSSALIDRYQRKRGHTNDRLPEDSSLKTIRKNHFSGSRY